MTQGPSVVIQPHHIHKNNGSHECNKRRAIHAFRRCKQKPSNEDARDQHHSADAWRGSLVKLALVRHINPIDLQCVLDDGRGNCDDSHKG